MTRLFLTLVVLAFFGFAQGQSFKFSVGYGIPWMSQSIGTNSSTTYTTTLNPATGAEIPRATNTSELVKGSYGAGWNASGAFGYQLSENIGLELGLTYSAGKKYTTHSRYADTRLEVLKSLSNETETSKSRAILFTPALRFMTHKRNFTPYFSIGPVLGKINFHRSLVRTTEEEGSVGIEFRNTKFTGGISLGLRGAVGVSVVVNRKLSLFSEIIFTGMNYYPKESEITSYIVNGEDKLNTLTENVRETVYVKKLTRDSNNTSEDVNAPKKSLRFPVGMSSLSLNAGVLIDLR
jgi:hypothetical protein